MLTWQRRGFRVRSAAAVASTSLPALRDRSVGVKRGQNPNIGVEAAVSKHWGEKRTKPRLLPLLEILVAGVFLSRGCSGTVYSFHVESSSSPSLQRRLRALSFLFFLSSLTHSFLSRSPSSSLCGAVFFSHFTATQIFPFPLPCSASIIFSSLLLFRKLLSPSFRLYLCCSRHHSCHLPFATFQFFSLNVLLI